MNLHTPESDSLMPTLRSDLTITVSRRDGQVVHLLEDPISGKVFKVGNREATFLLAMNGSVTVEQFHEQHGSLFEWDDLQQILQWAQQKQLWQDHSEEAIQRIRTQFHSSKAHRYTKWLNPISFQIGLGCPGRIVDVIYPAFHWLFRAWMVPVWLLLGVVSVTGILDRWPEFTGQTPTVMSQNGWLMMLVTWLVAKVIHEAAHAIAAKKVGARVSDCGLIFIVLMPLAYVDVSSVNRLTRRRDRMLVSFAGIYVETLLTFIALLIWLYCNDLRVQAWMQAWIITSGITTLLFNANPLMRFDGYYILSDGLDISNLAQRGRQVFWNSLGWLGFGWGEVPSLSHWREKALWTYGLAASVWRFLLTITLILTASALFHGAGIVIAALAVAFWWITPALQLLRRSWQQRCWETMAPKRTAVCLGTLATLVFLSFRWLSGPVWLAAPGIVELPPHSKVRIDAPGFVRRVLVSDNQQVFAGQPLLELDNPTIQVEIASLRSEIAQTELASRVNRQSEQWAQFEADQNHLTALKSQLQQKLAEEDGLIVRAPVGGRLLQRHPEQLLGTWMQKGQVALTLDNPAKEVSILVEQDDLPSLKNSMQRAVEIQAAGAGRNYGTLSTIVPNASCELIDEALASVNGGPLMVVPAADGMTSHEKKWKLIRPHFRATIVVNGKTELPSGQTATVYFRSKKQSLGTYLFLKARRWFQDHLPRVV